MHIKAKRMTKKSLSEIKERVLSENELGLNRLSDWTVARRYTFIFGGSIKFDLTEEDDIVYLCNNEDKPIAVVHLIIPKSYA